MVVIDDYRNGWRHIVLPVAHLDDLVKATVLSASASHFSANIQRRPFEADAIYVQAIHRLHQRQYLESQDVTGRQAVLLALLVILTTATVSGSTDWLVVFRMLESALLAVGGEDAIMKGELGNFLVKQIKKFRGYAAPFLSQQEGIARLSLTSSASQDAVDGWDCFMSYYDSSPDITDSLSIIYDLNRQACEIYVARALAGPDEPPLTGLVDQFVDTLKMLPAGSPGEHILVFATFLAASESISHKHQEYFTDVFLRHHRRNGFTNILTALEHLRKKWTGHSTQDWTKLLPDLPVWIM